jgi:hypothetical protein
MLEQILIAVVCDAADFEVAFAPDVSCACVVDSRVLPRSFIWKARRPRSRRVAALIEQLLQVGLCSAVLWLAVAVDVCVCVCLFVCVCVCLFVCVCVGVATLQLQRYPLRIQRNYFNPSASWARGV